MLCWCLCFFHLGMVGGGGGSGCVAGQLAWLGVS